MRWFAQEHPSSCVAACVRMVLAEMGHERTERDVRQLLGNPRFGLTLRRAANMLQEAGALVEWHDDWGLDDIRDCLREGNYPIVGVERRFFGHTSAPHAVVVTAVRGREIFLLDPLSAQPPGTQSETFVAAWRSAGQEALVVLSAPL